VLYSVNVNNFVILGYNAGSTDNGLGILAVHKLLYLTLFKVINVVIDLTHVFQAAASILRSNWCVPSNQRLFCLFHYHG